MCRVGVLTRRSVPRSLTKSGANAEEDAFGTRVATAAVPALVPRGIGAHESGHG
ncbi:hypothetical protein SUDANB95_04324 [Actinosynnema sp. ALI-1.44]